MKVFLIALAALSSSVSLAQVQHAEIVPVQNSEIRLLGKGIENRKTHETVTFACLDDCKQIRMVYFTSDAKNAYLFGPILTITTEDREPTTPEMKAVLKNFSKTFRKFKRDDNLSNHYGKMQGKMALIALASGGILTLGTIAMSPLIIPGAIAVFLGGGAMLVFAPGLFAYDPVTATFQDRDGWNWSSRPKKISSTKFEQLITLLNQSNGGQEITSFRR